VRYIDINDSEDVLRAIRMTARDVPIDIVLHTPGGLMLAALQVARAQRASFKSHRILPSLRHVQWHAHLSGANENCDVIPHGNWANRSAAW
jgi:Serine dehydrogenase proteinase